jgi:HlyD family secretion protein
VGTRVEIVLDSEPGRRVPGEVSFVADQANFTPEKIETRSDRIGQVYRAKVRILEGVERFAPGAEGNVYLLDDGAQPAVASERGSGA